MCRRHFPRACADFTRVLELDGSNANAYFNRGSTHDSLGAYDKAIAGEDRDGWERGMDGWELTIFYS